MNQRIFMRNPAMVLKSFSSVMSRRRFNLLLLEENEYFFEDYTCYKYSNNGGDNDVDENTFVKEKGRLKICSRSLVFEPDNIRVPILKFPFKYMRNAPHAYVWSRHR